MEIREPTFGFNKSKSPLKVAKFGIVGELERERRTARRPGGFMASSARLGPFMPLRELVEKYLAIAGEFGTPIALRNFKLPHKDTESIFSLFDEDYHISRFFDFSAHPGGDSYDINGFPYTHVSIAAEVKTIL
jgi:hypothetical protein